MAVCCLIFCTANVKAEEIILPVPTTNIEISANTDVSAGVNGNIIDAVKGEQGKCHCCKCCPCGCQGAKKDCKCEKSKCECSKCCPECCPKCPCGCQGVKKDCNCEKSKCECSKCCPECCPKCPCGCQGNIIDSVKNNKQECGCSK